MIPNLERRYRDTENQWVREELARIPKRGRVRDLRRLSPEAGGAGGQASAAPHIGEVATKSIGAAAAWFHEVEPDLTAKQREIAHRILKEINERLGFLVDVGLEYLTLSRNSGTLSGGESQRIRLASQIGSGLTGVLYVLDEPSIGLHQRDNARLLKTLENLRELGNTVVVVEHDEDAIRTADYLVDMGPGAGEHGGQVVAEGTPDKVIADAASLTGQYLSGRRKIAVPLARREGKRIGKGRSAKRQEIRVRGARENNLADVDVGIPLGTLTCVTGVSGSGKSSLIVDTLYPAVARRINRARLHPGEHDAIEGLEYLDKVVDIDQSPIGRTPRSNPATYTGAFTYDPRLVRRPARGQGARLQARAFLVQRQGRALRGVPGRRRDQDRDALPARRLCHLRHLPRRALQPRNA